ncbi:hypothetical protein H9P43_003025 [Blastocladiella emersonii ATCC 22665]|nr:hypothetical protein H9P43_003025 [Blastocladiella emersonii ATCC 22665]
MSATSRPFPPVTPYAISASVTAGTAFGGALLLSMVSALCASPRPRTRLEGALHVAALCQLVAIGINVQLNYYLPGDPTLAFALRTTSNWCQFIAMVFATFICYRRAAAIRVYSPIAANWVAPALLVILVLASVAVRVAGTLSELNLLAGVRDPPALFQAQQIARATVNFGSAVHALFSELYVTSVIARFREGSTGGGRGSRSKRARRSAVVAHRVRIAFAIIITTTFLAQSTFLTLVLYRITTFAALYATGWTMVLVRIYQFKSELASTTTPSVPSTLGESGSDSRPGSRVAAGSSAAVPPRSVTERQLMFLHADVDAAGYQRALRQLHRTPPLASVASAATDTPLLCPAAEAGTAASLPRRPASALGRYSQLGRPSADDGDC